MLGSDFFKSSSMFMSIMQIKLKIKLIHIYAVKIMTTFGKCRLER